MKNFCDLLQDIYNNGVGKDNRTEISTKAVFGRMLRWDLSEGFPIITTRKVPLRIAFEETMFFLRGETNTKNLEEKGINIWKGNTSREFLDGAGMHNLPEGSIGTGYSHQWRNFGGDIGVDNGVDQVKQLLNGLMTQPESRRHLITAWNPLQLSGTPLPPCHVMHMYSVVEGKLNSMFVMRSNDVYHGLPFNIMGYALLNHIFAGFLNLEPGELVYSGWDVHLYDHQLPVVREQMKRIPRKLPILKINKDLVSFTDIMDLKWEDIELVGYDPHPALEKVDMAI